MGAGVAGIALTGGAVGENASFPGLKTVQALAITDATNMIVFDSDGANTGTISMASLTASRTWTFPDANVTITAGTGVVNTGTPLDNQLAVWTSATAIEGDPNFTWDGSTLLMVGALNIGSGALTAGVATITSLNLTAATNQIVLDSDGANTGTITMVGLTGNRIYTFPDENVTITAGTIPTLSGTPVDNQVAIWTSATNLEGDANFTFDGTNLAIGTSGYIGWTDTQIHRDAANTFAFYNGSNSQQLNIYNTRTDGSNFERLEISSNGSIWSINSASAGSGSDQDLLLEIGGVNLLEITTTEVIPYVTTRPNTTNAQDLGLIATNWRTGYFGTSLQAGIALTSPTDVVILDAPDLGGAGQQDSHSLLWTGLAFDSVPHDADWKAFVDVTSNAGASTWTLQSRIDAAGYATRMSVSDAGVATFSGTFATANLALTDPTLQIVLDSDGTFTGTISMASLTGSRTWIFPDATGGVVVNSGTPLNNELAVWTTASTVEGDSGLTWDGSVLLTTGAFTGTSLNLTDASNQIVLDSDSVFTGTVTLAALSVSRTYTFPNATGNVTLTSGFPLNNQLAVWTSSFEVEGDSGLTWDGSVLLTTGAFTGTNLSLTDATNQIVLDSDGTFTGTVTMAGLSANRTYTFPDDDVTIGAGNVSTTGTPLLNEVAIWVNSTTLRGEPEVTYNGSVFEVTGTNLLQAAGLRLTNSVNQIRLDHGGTFVGTITMASLSGNRSYTWPDNNVTFPSGPLVGTTGTPMNNSVAVFTGADTLDGDTGLSFNGSVLSLSGGGSTGSITLAATSNQIRLDANNGSGFHGTFTTVAMGAARIWTLPDAGGGIVLNTGTPLNNELAVWTTANVIEGDSNLTWDATTLSVLNVTITNDLNLSAGVAFGIEFDNGTAGAADTIDWNAGNNQRSTLDENVTYTFTDPPGPTKLVLRIIQDAGGTNTVTWPASVEWEGGAAPTISAGSNAIDVVSFYHDGTTYYGSFLQNFS